ncbi:MAG: hydantoinase B/oxoprolinase family protein, partial [Halobacteria archaeon]|nr:hydantoinase B/oxoprolinase family protein [Halobacteria archaeon]
PRDDTPYAFYETQGGGFGARRGKDGMDGVHVHMSNTLNTPAEVLETEYPLRVRRYEFRTDSGGAGEWRGGLGLRRDIEVLGEGEGEDTTTFSLLADRRRNAPYGLEGGHEGAKGEDYLVRNGEKKRLDPKSTHELVGGDTVSIRTPGGGGYGNPEDRDEDSVLRDVLLGKVSEEEARTAYGVDTEVTENR